MADVDEVRRRMERIIVSMRYDDDNKHCGGVAGQRWCISYAHIQFSYHISSTNNMRWMAEGIMIDNRHVVHNEEAKIKIRMDQITPPKDNDRLTCYVVQKEGDNWQ